MKKFRPQPGFQVQAFRFALDPNSSQEAALRSHCGAARAAYNWAVGWVTASWWQRKAEVSYGVPEDALTGWRPWSLPALRKAFNEAKHTGPRFAGWWEENSKEAYSTGLANAAAAFDNYAKSKQGRRHGKRMGAPRFKPKRKARLACRFTTGTIRVDGDGRHVTLPRLGTIRTHEPAAGLHARVQAGTARILSATVRHERGRWFVSFQAEVKQDMRRVARPDAAVGIDLGVKTLAVMADSTGEIRTAANPGHYDAARKHLRRASRTVSRRSLRRLHLLFQERRESVAATVRRRRLEGARADLLRPELHSRPIHAVAARWGFASAAVFSRAFREAYGTSPSELRAGSTFLARSARTGNRPPPRLQQAPAVHGGDGRSPAR
ncbi:helix-turn-helix domain-containing protein [Streptomyces sp. NPDC051183]|uniref:helix-turn-helix domain-containing protein n=1 Tax=Streptomyces sp. NPDC051183 TaxID=3155165 RepID=UPI0034144709